MAHRSWVTSRCAVSGVNSDAPSIAISADAVRSLHTASVGSGVNPPIARTMLHPSTPRSSSLARDVALVTKVHEEHVRIGQGCCHEHHDVPLLDKGRAPLPLSSRPAIATVGGTIRASASPSPGSNSAVAVSAAAAQESRVIHRAALLDEPHSPSDPVDAGEDRLAAPEVDAGLPPPLGQLEGQSCHDAHDTAGEAASPPRASVFEPVAVEQGRGLRGCAGDERDRHDSQYEAQVEGG